MPTASAQPVKPQPRPSGNQRGKWTIGLIFLFGVAVLVGLRLAPKSVSPIAPAGLVSGLPDRTLSIVLFDCSAMGVQPEAIVQTIKACDANPDILLFVNIEPDLLTAMTQAFAMQRSYHPALYQRVQLDLTSRTKSGVCILSKLDLYEGRALLRQPSRVVGVGAIVATEGKKFSMACVDSTDGLGLPYAALNSDGNDLFAGLSITVSISDGQMSLTEPSRTGGEARRVTNIPRERGEQIMLAKGKPMLRLFRINPAQALSQD